MKVVLYYKVNTQKIAFKLFQESAWVIRKLSHHRILPFSLDLLCINYPIILRFLF